MLRHVSILAAFVVVALSVGCFGQSKATGKFSNQDKPKPVGESGK